MIGYQVTTVTPANMAPIAAAALPSMMILPCGGVHRLDHIRVLLGQRAGGIIESGADGVQVQLCGFDLLRKLLANRLLDPLHVDRKQLCGNTYIDHILDQLADLCVRAGGGSKLDRRAQDSRSDPSASH